MQEVLRAVVLRGVGFGDGAGSGKALCSCVLMMRLAVSQVTSCSFAIMRSLHTEKRSRFMYKQQKTLAWLSHTMPYQNNRALTDDMDRQHRAMHMRATAHLHTRPAPSSTCPRPATNCHCIHQQPLQYTHVRPCAYIQPKKRATHMWAHLTSTPCILHCIPFLLVILSVHTHYIFPLLSGARHPPTHSPYTLSFPCSSVHTHAHLTPLCPTFSPFSVHDTPPPPLHDHAHRAPV